MVDMLRKNKKPRKKIIVDDYNFELSTKEILNLLSDGKYHTTKGRVDEEPFKSLTKVSPSEISEYVDDDDQDSVERYMEKKRSIPLQQFSALKLLGITNKKSRTIAATYSLSLFGKDIVTGLRLLQAIKEKGLGVVEALKAIEQYAEEKLEKEKERPN